MACAEFLCYVSECFSSSYAMFIMGEQKLKYQRDSFDYKMLWEIQMELYKRFYIPIRMTLL